MLGLMTLHFDLFPLQSVTISKTGCINYRIVYSLLDGYVLATTSRVGKISTAISLKSDAIIPAFARANVSNMAMMATIALENLPDTHYLPSPTHFLFQIRNSYASSASYQILTLLCNEEECQEQDYEDDEGKSSQV